MRVITWNINSVRLRLDLVLRLLEEHQPDVLCLQETKVVNDAFPRKAFLDRGYGHQLLDGMKSYNGVAILSRWPLGNVAVHSWCGRADCRHVSATLAVPADAGTLGGGIEVHCVYVPSGGDVPDPEVNDKFAHKLRFLEEMATWWPQARRDTDPMVLVGDLNIAPQPNDVWSHAQMVDVVSHTPVEVERLEALRASLGWIDAGRRFVPDGEKLYTWWSYRAKDWLASNRGRRLDHAWVTPALAPALTDCRTLAAARGWEPKPSDHVPVILDLGSSHPEPGRAGG